MRIDGTRLVSIKPEMLEMLKNLEVGDALKGRVLEALGNSIAIRTAGGQIFTALLQEGASIPKGASVELVVSSLADGKIYAEFRPEVMDTDMDAKVSQFLKQVSLPVDEKNIEAAKLLIKYNLPVDKEAIMNITGLQKSIESLNQSSEGKVALLLSGLDIKNTPVDVLNKIVLGWNSEMIKAETPVHAEKGEEAPDLNFIAKNNVNLAIAEDDNKSQTINSTKVLPDVIKPSSTELDATESSTDKPAASPGEAVKAMPQERGTVYENKGAELLKVLEKLGIETGSEAKSFAGQVAGILDSIQNTDMKSVAYLVSKEMDATPKNLSMLVRNIENTDDISQFLDKLQHRLKEENNPELKEIRDSIKKIFLEPRQVENPEEVKEQIKDIARLGEKLEGYLESSGRKDPEVREVLSNLRDNIDFIRSINEHSNFMQIPVMINGDTSTAKLYVFKEGKRSKAIDPENATVLVALDLKSLGHMESMIGIKGKAVNVTFRVENKEIGTLIEKHSEILKKSLKEKGYSLSPVRIVSLEQPFSLISLEELISEGSSGKIHFDKRI